MATKIDKIVLDISGKKIELTLEEAKQVKAALGQILGEDRIVTIPAPYPAPSTPPWKYVPYTGVRWPAEPYSDTISEGSTAFLQII